MGELGISSLDYVYDMTWAEFQIRLFAFNRMEKNNWLKLREILWVTLISSHQDPKKLPKTKDAFMSLDGGKKEVKGATEEQKQAFLKATEQYLANVKNRD